MQVDLLWSPPAQQEVAEIDQCLDMITNPCKKHDEHMFHTKILDMQQLNSSYFCTLFPQNFYFEKFSRTPVHSNTHALVKIMMVESPVMIDG